MPAGRPTKYNKAILERANTYIDECDDAVPIAAGMAVALGIGKRTIYAWAEEHEEFQHTLDRMNAKQEVMLASGGLTNVFNSTIAKLMLSNHGYSDKAETFNKHEIDVIEIKDDFGDS